MEITKQIILDFFEGKTTSIQRKNIELWLEMPENEDVYFKYLDEWEGNNKQFEVQKNKADLLFETDLIEIERESGFSILKKYKFGVWIAAAMLIYFFSWIQNLQISEKVPQKSIAEIIKRNETEIIERENQGKKPIFVKLPDGSNVILQMGSKLSFSPKNYNQKFRKVFLKGDGFFEVIKNKSIPFLVYSNNTIVKAVGTSFYVNSKLNTLEIIVKSGKVAVYNSKVKANIDDENYHKIILVENQKVDLNNENVSHIEVKESLTKNEFYHFDNQPASDVLLDLEKRYFVKINFDYEKLKNCRITAKFTDEPLEEKLKVLCFVINANFEEKNNEFYIYSKGCQ